VAANFNTFLGRMTGPSRLRYALRESSRPLFNLLTAVNNFGDVKTKLPSEVLGGEIFGLLSNRLKQLLEATTQAETVVSRSPTSRRTLIDDFTYRESGKTLLTVSDSPVRKLVGSANSDDDELARLRRIMAEPASPRLPAARDQVFATSREGAAESVFSLLSTPAGGNVRMVSDLGELLARYKQTGNAEMPLLEKKLRQYWKLSQPVHTDDSNPSESSPASNLLQTSVPGFSEPLAFTPASRPWAEVVGRELSRKARAAGNHFPGDISKSTSQRSAEKVEIQNVFNIEVRNEASSAHGLDDLSEKITEILNEQALQHGIDVT